MAGPRLHVKGATLFDGVKQILAIVLVPSPIGTLFRFLSNSLSITTRIFKIHLDRNKGPLLRPGKLWGNKNHKACLTALAMI